MRAYKSIRTPFSGHRGDQLQYPVMIFLSILFLLPLLWTILSSFRPATEIFQYVNPLTWKTFVPQHFTILNYVHVFVDQSFLKYIGNSFFVSVTQTVIGLFVNALAAYSFARLEFPGKNLIFGLFIVTIIVPFEVEALPLYLMINKFGWIDTFPALIIPGIASAFSVFLLRQFFLEIPRDLEDAARIDGASSLVIFFRIIVPLTWPALISVALISYQSIWDAFLWPLLVTTSTRIEVIQVAIGTFYSRDAIYWDLIFAACSVATWIPIVMFIVLQRYYLRSIAMTGIKG